MAEHTRDHELATLRISHKPLPDSCLSEFQLTDNLKMLRVRFGLAYLLVRYRVGETVYYVPNDEVWDYHIALVDRLVRDGLVGRKEKKDLLEKIDRLI